MKNGSAIRTGACLLWSVNPRGRRIDLARQFALRLQLSAITRDTPEARPVRRKKRSALIKPSLLLETTSHTAMGVAVGLAFAFLVTHITALGIAAVINYSPAPDAVTLMFVGTCAISVGMQMPMVTTQAICRRRRRSLGRFRIASPAAFSINAKTFPTSIPANSAARSGEDLRRGGAKV